MTLKIAKTQCESCIFGPNSPIRAGRMRELARGWQRDDNHQICHAFGHAEEDEDGETEFVGEDVVCRGFYDTQPHGQMLRIAERLNLLEFVDPPTLEEMRERLLP